LIVLLQRTDLSIFIYPSFLFSGQTPGELLLVFFQRNVANGQFLNDPAEYSPFLGEIAGEISLHLL
jgi:hypothetical protein